MSLTFANSNLLKTKPHYETLDGLRGIAAIAVVIFHFMEIATPDYKDNFIAHSYLAVDFFFCLSGFVIAYAYDNKIKTIGVKTFLKLRLIRLEPLVFIGALIGLFAFILDPFSDLSSRFGMGQIFLMFLSAVFLIPYPSVPERYFNLFHLNPPTWSLFWEYIANIVYAVVLHKASLKVLKCLVAIGAMTLCYEAYTAEYLGVGWGVGNVTGGGIRIFYSFTVGMLIFRLHWHIKNRIGFIGVALLLACTFFTPFSEKWNFIVDPLLAVFYFPFLIVLGSGTDTLKGVSHTVCSFLGRISYPLYMVHYPFIWLFMSYVEEYKPTMSQMKAIIPASVLLLIVLAYVVLICLDEPIRKYLTKKMKKETTPI